MITLKTGTVIDESMTSPNSTPGSLSQAVFGRPRSMRRTTLHHWDAPENRPTFDGTCRELMRSGSGKSIHFVVEAGRVACLVSPSDVAWHSGSAEGNATSIGIELNPRASEGDVEECAALIAWIEEVYGDQEIWLHQEWFSTACPGRYANLRDKIIYRVNSIRSGNFASAPAQEVVDTMGIIRSELENIRASASRIEGELN